MFPNHLKIFGVNNMCLLKKLKRLLLKVNVLVNKGCIVFLQETHIVDTKYLEMTWKHGFLSNCVKTNSAGVIILYNKYADFEGRQLIAVIGNDERKIFVNAYFPNDNRKVCKCTPRYLR